MKLVPLALLAAVSAAAAGAGPSRAAAAQDDRSCPADPAQVPSRPVKVEGVVVGPVSPERARASTRWVEGTTGMKISPDYAGLPRVAVRIVGGRAASETLAAVVDGHVPGPGDRVDVLSRHRDPRSRCRFIPWTVGSAPATS